MRKVIYSPRAISDLNRIADRLKRRSPRGAQAVGRRIEEVIDRLAEFPGIGSRLEQRPEVLVFPLIRFPYMIFYAVTDRELEILHVRHTSRRSVNPETL